MSVDKTRINWNVLFRAIRSYSVIVHLELVDDLFLHERKLQFLHCKTTTSWAISTRKSGRPACNKDPLSNLIPYHFVPLCTSRKFMERKQTINAEKVLFLFSSSYSSSHIRRKKQKSRHTPDDKKLSKKPKGLRHQKKSFKSSKCYRKINWRSAK